MSVAEPGDAVQGLDLDHSYIGEFLGRTERGYNRQGEILELIRAIPGPSGLWHATIWWGGTPALRSAYLHSSEGDGEPGGGA
jgi:hypothetical protein